MGTSQRPFVLVADHEAVDMAHVELHGRLLVPAVGRALEKMIEKALLQFHTVVGVERCPMRAAVRLQPLLRGRGAQVALEIAARMQALPAPVGSRQERHRHLREIGSALAIVVGQQRALEQLGPHVLAVGDEFFFREGLRAAHQFAGDAAFRSALAHAVLYGLDLHVLPVLAEGADDAAVAVAVAVVVPPAFPHADGGEVWWLRGGGAPLVGTIVGNAV